MAGHSGQFSRYSYGGTAHRVVEFPRTRQLPGSLRPVRGWWNIEFNHILLFNCTKTHQFQIDTTVLS